VWVYLGPWWGWVCRGFQLSTAFDQIRSRVLLSLAEVCLFPIATVSLWPWFKRFLLLVQRLVDKVLALGTQIPWFDWALNFIWFVFQTIDRVDALAGLGLWERKQILSSSLMCLLLVLFDGIWLIVALLALALLCRIYRAVLPSIERAWERLWLLDVVRTLLEVLYGGFVLLLVDWLQVLERGLVGVLPGSRSSTAHYWLNKCRLGLFSFHL
jgi:hypothetical protein